MECSGCGRLPQGRRGDPPKWRPHPDGCAPHRLQLHPVELVRAAHQDVVESLAVLVDQNMDNPYLSFAHWLSQFTLPWSLLFLGEWGEALRILAAEITLADKNGDRYRGHTLQLYQAWIHLHAMDFPGVLEICNSILPSLEEPARSPWRRFCLALMGSAEAASGRYAAAADHL